MPFRTKKDSSEPKRGSGWVTVKVNLRAAQYESLRALADELGLSTSRVTRRVLAQFLANREADREADPSLRRKSG